MKNALKRAIQQHYDNAQLDETQLQQLMDLQSQVQQDDDKYLEKESLAQLLRRLFYFPVPLGFSILSAVAILILTTSVFLMSKLYQPALNELITAEIAYNHNKRSKLEVESSNLIEINDYFTRLNFTPIQSIKLPGTHWQLLGGRYCSIQGAIAAQLRLREKNSNKVYTLYQSHIPEDFRELSVNSVHLSDNVRVSLWIEGGLLMGLAVDK